MNRENVSDVQQLREAIRLTREHVGARTLPAVEGWAWYDAIGATGGFEGFGPCGYPLDPSRFGRPVEDSLRLHCCTLQPGHVGDHTLISLGDPTSSEQV